MTSGKRLYRGRKYRDCERRLEATYEEENCAQVENTDQERKPLMDTEQGELVVDLRQKEPMEDDTEAKKFGEALFKSVQDLARQIEVMGQRFTVVEARKHETPWVFQVGEGSGTSHHLPEQGTAQCHIPQPTASCAPTRSTMPTFLGVDTGARAQQEAAPRHLDEYFVEYQSYE